MDDARDGRTARMGKAICVGVLLLSILALAGSTPSIAKEEIGSLFNRGLQMENEGDYVTAIYIFQDVLERNRYFIDAKIALARCYLKTGNLQESEALLKDSLRQERGNAAARNLLGRVHIAMKRYDDAQAEFNETLAGEPANIEAKYGLADIYRLKGEFRRAIGVYEEVLKLYPQETRTYINLGNCYTEMGELERAGGYFRKAVSLDSQSPWTHLNLARHYYKMGVKYYGGEGFSGAAAPGERALRDKATGDKFFDAALAEAETALEADRRLPDPHAVIAQVHFYRKDYSKALDAYRKLAANGKASRGTADAAQGQLLLYETGYCFETLGDLEGAGAFYSDALARRIDDEVTRFRLEETLLALYRENLSEPKRVRLSDEQFEKARFNLDRMLMDKAAVRLNRAVQLDPLNPRKRRALAEVFRRRGFPELYVFELERILKENLGVDTLELNDTVEVFQSRIANNLASRWGVSQYQEEEDEKAPGYFPRTRTRVAVLDAFSSNYIAEDFLHRRLSKTFGEMLALQLSSGAPRGMPVYPKIQVVEAPGEVEDRGDAFKKALAIAPPAEYYVTGSLEEREDSLKATVDLLSGVNGRLVARFDTYFTGNDKLFNTVFSVAESINGAVPLVGQIVRLRGNRALINLGTSHGARKEMSFLIYRKGGLRKSPETGEFIADPAVALGTLTVTETDEAVSEGTYVYTGTHNRVNLYDSVILEALEPPAEKEKTRGENVGAGGQ